MSLICSKPIIRPQRRVFKVLYENISASFKKSTFTYKKILIYTIRRPLIIKILLKGSLIITKASRLLLNQLKGVKKDRLEAERSKGRVYRGINFANMAAYN